MVHPCKDDPGIVRKGVRARTRRTALQFVDLDDQQMRMAVEQFHSEKEGFTRNPIAAITRHSGKYAWASMVIDFAPHSY
jgi:hypothetical protein